MAPVSTGDSDISNTSAVGTDTPISQILLGITLPLVAVATFIPIIMIRSHLRTKRFISQRSRAEQAIKSARAQATPRLPMNSVYIARVDYYLPPSNTGGSFSIAVAESTCDAEDSTGLAVRVDTDEDKLDHDYSATPSQGPGLSLQAPPTGSLLSLSSMLGEFTAYADAIDSEPQLLQLADIRRSSTCLLDSVFSSMDVQALSSAELLHSPSPAPPQYSTVPTSVAIEASHLKSTGIKEASYTDAQSVRELYNFLLCEDDPIVFQEHHIAGDNSCSGSSSTLPVISEDAVEEINTSHLVPATTTTSFILDSCSTLASFLAVRLSQFPAVPAFPALPILGFAARSITAQRSETSLGSTLTYSITAPASLNILDIQLSNELTQRRPSGPYLLDWPSFSNPGELWDEEDDLLFSACLPRRPIDLTNPMRHTWTAGVKYSRSDKGDLWDDEDDRRFSLVGPSLPVDIFVSSSMFSLEMSGDGDLGDSTLQSSEVNSLADHDCEDRGTMEEIGDQTLCCLEAGFAELNLSLSFEFGECFVSLNELDIKCSEFISDPGVCCSSTSTQTSISSSCRFEFDNHSSVDIKSIYLSEAEESPSPSPRSSFMSLVSVLDSTIRVVDPSSAVWYAYGCEDHLVKMFGVVDDMEVENDSSFSSSIISVNYPLDQQLGEEYVF